MSGEQAEMKEAMKMMQQMMKGEGKASATRQPADEGGDLKITRYVTSISRGALSDALFEVPKGYKQDHAVDASDDEGDGRRALSA